jgi:uracil-DNA glycosylase family 4
MGRVFINYRRQDSEGYVGRLFDHLVQHLKREAVFMDVDSIPPGADFEQVLDEAVMACDVFIAVIGPHWIDAKDESGERRLDQWNDFVRIEIASALKHEKRIIPVLVGQAKMPRPDQLPEDIRPLARRNAVPLSHLHFAGDVLKLSTVIQDAFPAAQPTKAKTSSEAAQRKAAALKQVRDDLVGATHSPLYPFRNENRYFPVIGEGNPDATFFLIGESPGKAEAATGRTFVGPSGEVLEELLRGIGLEREDVYMTNVILDHPGKRDPLPHEIDFYGPFVDRLIAIVQPTVLVTLGSFAMEYILRKLNVPEKRGKISQLHGKLIKAQLDYGEIHVVPMYHPAMTLYTPAKKDTLRQDFSKLKLFL